MSLPLTFTLYVARRFTAMVLALLLALTGLVSLFDFIELLRRAATRAEASFGIVATIGGLRLPTAIVQEGGYQASVIGDPLKRFLQGLRSGISGCLSPARRPRPRSRQATWRRSRTCRRPAGG